MPEGRCFISKTYNIDQVWARLQPSIQLPCPFVFLSLLFRNFNFPVACINVAEKRYRYIDRYIRAWISYRKLITFRKYTVWFSRIAFVSIGLSTYQNLDYPVYCCFAASFFSVFFFSFSICLFLFLVFLVSQKSEGNMMQLKLAWLAMQTRSQGISGLYIYTLALFFIWWYLKSERTKGERISSALYAEFSM